MAKLLAFVEANWMTLTLVTLMAITLISLWPLDKLPLVPGADKTHHIIAYAILMFPVALRKPDRWILFGLFFVAYGGAIEFLQPYVNRYGEWHEMAANVSGLICGLIFAELIKCFYPSIFKQPR